MGKRTERTVRIVYDCDGGCENKDIEVKSRIQYGTNQQSGENYRRYLCLSCTGGLKGWLGMRNAKTNHGDF